MTYTIKKIAKKYGLSRSTLLYYESIGLLKARTRSQTNYRLYGEKECERLTKISELRAAGVPLMQIKALLDGRTTTRSVLLKERLVSINKEIASLRLQQKAILDLLGAKGLLKETRIVTKEQWIHFLKKAGLDEKGMCEWHREFEKCSPEAHQDFLESLHLSKDEIKEIRAFSQMSERS
jgi:DNA-binding transcriptional MerR regulator